MEDGNNNEPNFDLFVADQNLGGSMRQMFSSEMSTRLLQTIGRAFIL
jgi:hypothetical protein